MSVNQEEKWAALKISDILSANTIQTELKAATKKEVITELVDLLAKEGKIKDAADAVRVLMEREAIGTTGIGQGIAIPHAKTDQTADIVAALGIARRGVQFNSLDEQPVYIVFLLLAPAQASGAHLIALGRISRMLKDKFFRQSLRDMKNAGEILKRIREEDQY